jgi:hypothetical protein
MTNRSTQTYRSITMNTLTEALARDRMRETHRGASRTRLVRELAAARRWERWQARAERAASRHSRRADEAASTLAVAR